MKTTTRITMTLAAFATAATLIAAPVFAQDTQWQKDHPKREQVNGRLDNQNKRITQEKKEGEITKAQAKNLRANDKAVRGEEKQMASTNGGHITNTEQKALNQQLNQNSKAIGK
jgi:septal ring factor EnvC (AmiA/AmiB activator)